MVQQPNSYLSRAADYEVIAPAVVVARLGGAVEGYYYSGARLPADASPAELERLESLGMIRRITEGEPK